MRSSVLQSLWSSGLYHVRQNTPEHEPSTHQNSCDGIHILPPAWHGGWPSQALQGRSRGPAGFAFSARELCEAQGTYACCLVAEPPAPGLAFQNRDTLVQAFRTICRCFLRSRNLRSLTASGPDRFKRDTRAPPQYPSTSARMLVKSLSHRALTRSLDLEARVKVNKRTRVSNGCGYHTWDPRDCY